MCGTNMLLSITHKLVLTCYIISQLAVTTRQKYGNKFQSENCELAAKFFERQGCDFCQPEKAWIRTVVWKGSRAWNTCWSWLCYRRQIGSSSSKACGGQWIQTDKSRAFGLWFKPWNSSSTVYFWHLQFLPPVSGLQPQPIQNISKDGILHNGTWWICSKSHGVSILRQKHLLCSQSNSKTKNKSWCFIQTVDHLFKGITNVFHCEFLLHVQRRNG